MSATKKLLLLSNLLCSRGLISNTEKAYLKEMILRGDARLATVLADFEASGSGVEDMSRLQRMIATEARSIYGAIFEQCPLDKGKHLSKSERDAKGLVNEKSLIYGEVDYANFMHTLKKIRVAPGSTFVDLGSGTARAVFTARLNFDFGQCVGVELLEGLYRASTDVVDTYRSGFQHFLSPQYSNVEVHNGDLRRFDWAGADVVFANSTCFDDDLMNDMSDLAANLRPGSIFITFTKSLNSDQFRILDKERLTMSWGAATVFVQERIDPGNAQAATDAKLARSEYFDDIDSTSSDEEAAAAPPAAPSPANPRRPGNLLMQRAPGVETAQRSAISSPQGDSLLKRKHMLRR